MSEEAVEDVGGGAVDSAPVESSAPVETSTPVAEPDVSDFSVPDEYKERSWAEKIKSNDDLYKQIDNLNELVGKKTVQPINYETASEEDIAAYHKSLVPEDTSLYTFSEEADADFSQAMIPVLQEAGIHPSQLAILEPALNKIASELTAQEYAKDRSSEGYDNLAKEAFGESFKDEITRIEKAYIDTAPDDVKAFLDNASNNDRVMFDRTVKAIMDAKDAEIAKVRAEYGASETGAQIEGTPATQTVSINDQIEENYKKIEEINNARGVKDWSALEKLKVQRRELFDKKAKTGK